MRQGFFERRDGVVGLARGGRRHPCVHRFHHRGARELCELLAQAGVKYIGDWVYDDEPTVIRTAKGPLVPLPYTVELNDIPMMLIQHHESDYLLKRTIDQFDRLYAESAKRAKFCSASRYSGPP